MFAATDLIVFAQQQQLTLDDAGGILETLMKYLYIIAAVGIVLTILYIACYWLIFTKAGYPGWAQFIPIYNILVILWIAGKPGWWILLLFIPIVNIFIAISVLIGLSRNFGHGVGFALGLLFFGFIFLPILAFGSSEYIGDRGNAY